MIITKTPLRINLVNPPLHLKGGQSKNVICATVDKHVYCVVRQRLDNQIYVNYSKKEVVPSLEKLRHELVREAMKKTGVKKGVEISFFADLPARLGGGSLGASTATTVGVLNALYHLAGYSPSSDRLEKEAYEIEAEILGKPVEPSDHHVIVNGGVKLLKLSEEKGRQQTKVLERLDKTEGFRKALEGSNMLFIIEKRRYFPRKDERKRWYPKIHQAVGSLTQEIVRALKEEEFDEVGEFLDDIWELIAERQPVKIKNIYRDAREAGALGGTTAFTREGGHFLFLVPSVKRNKVSQAMRNFREEVLKLEPFGTRVIFSEGG